MLFATPYFFETPGIKYRTIVALWVQVTAAEVAPERTSAIYSKYYDLNSE